MIYKTAREIIKAAYFYANMKNAAVTDFYYNTQLLNDVYSYLYLDLVNASDDYIKWADFSDKLAIPEDCYMILGVYNKPSLSAVNPAPKNQYNIDGYHIENNVIKMSHPGNYTVKYSTLQPTLTAPDEPLLLDIAYDEIGAMDSDGFYFKKDDIDYYYDFSEQEYSETDSYQEYTAPEYGDEYDIDGLTVKAIDIHTPYAAVTYSDSSTYIWTGNDKALYNINAIHGHPTNIAVLRLYTDDVTGKGLLYTDNGKLYYGSFVPDTVLSFPSQVYFSLLEYYIAANLLSLNGMDNSYLMDTQIPRAEAQFAATAKKNTRPYRKENVLRRV